MSALRNSVVPILLMVSAVGCSDSTGQNSASNEGKCIVHTFGSGSFDHKKLRAETDTLTEQVSVDMFGIVSESDVLTCDSFYDRTGYCTAHKNGTFIVVAGLEPIKYVIEGKTPFSVSYHAGGLHALCPVMEGANADADAFLKSISEAGHRFVAPDPKLKRILQ